VWKQNNIYWTNEVILCICIYIILCTIKIAFASYFLLPFARRVEENLYFMKQRQLALEMKIKTIKVSMCLYLFNQLIICLCDFERTNIRNSLNWHHCYLFPLLFLVQKQPNPFASDPFIILNLLQEDLNILQLIKTK
jgi:hypothetical protein